jgi:hypothetical protein
MRGATIALLTFLVLVVSPAAAKKPPTGGAQPPLRVYVIVLDGLEPQEIGTLTPTLSGLKSQGTWYDDARAVFPAETIPNHVAMMTGVLPERNGIIGNNWAHHYKIGGFAYKDMDEPRLLEAPTVTTQLENQCPISTATVQSKSYLWGIFRGEPAAYPPGDTWPGDAIVQREADFHWRAPFFIPFSDHHIDAGTMDALRNWIKTTPSNPQFAFVNLGDIDRSGHIDESGSLTDGGVSAFRTAVISDTDALLGQFVDELKQSGAWDQTVLIFASDHSMDWSPVQGWGNDNDAEDRAVNVTGTLTGAGYTYTGQAKNPWGPGQFHTVSSGGTAAVYTDPSNAAGMARALAAHPGVAVVATRESVPDLGNPTHHELGMDNPNNGEVVVFVKAGWAVRDGGNQSGNNPLPGNHGHPETQPSALLVAGGHPVLDDQPQTVTGEQVYDPARRPFSPPAGGPGNLSITPTVTALFGLKPPEGGYDGAPLAEAFDAGALKVKKPRSCAG